MAQLQRPLVIQSQIIRLCCPRTSRRTAIGLVAGGKSHRKLHTKTVTDNDISRLASLPLHPLTLADLVKYVLSCDLEVTNLRGRAWLMELHDEIDTDGRRLPHNNSSPRPISPSPSSPHASRTAFNRSATYPLSLFPIHTCPRYTPITYTVCRRCCHGQSTRSRRWKRRSSSPKSWLTWCKHMRTPLVS